MSSVTVTRTDGTVTASWDAPSGAAKYHVTYNDGTGWHAPVSGHDNWPSTQHNLRRRQRQDLRRRRPRRERRRLERLGQLTRRRPLHPAEHARSARSGKLRLHHPRRRDGHRILGRASGAAKYHVTYNDGTGWHAPVPGHDNITATSLTFSADNARTYVVGVRAGNAAGWSGWRNSPAAGPYTPPPVNP